MKLFIGILLALAAVAAVSADKMRFDHHKVFNLKVASEEQMQILRQLEESAAEGEYVFGDSPVVGRDVDVVVPPHKLYEFNGIMKKFNIIHELEVENLQTLIDAETPIVQPNSVDWTSYHNYTTIYAWLDELLETYSDVLSSHLIGTTYQNRPIRAVKLSHKTGNPTIFLESNIHAREWITSATATWWLNELLTSDDPDIVDLAQNIDWYIIPVFNVDGFHYSHEVNRLWRKTRQNHATICFGTDANRNFNFQWMVNNGASDNPCSETYAGPYAFSEVETRALSDFLAPIGRQINIYLSFHSYGQYILFPYGHTRDEVTEYHDIMTDVGNATREGFAQFNGTEYVVGTTAAALYVASGTSVDWAFNEFDIPIGYTFEFRGGSYGFVLPADQILPNCYETRDGIIAMVQRARALGYMDVRT
ncbi:zinc carboxypeptidase-like [Bradysia coprophila]|uniref:zinc carboxypeptidase-like n=1 Tax=Bradysia coprophila TaxID=38358 RepID=UPI00187D7BF9|nr:zinc carboxypeptidase-like [Bradysia coprophila]